MRLKHSREQGRRWESRAKWYLRRRGLVLLEANYLCRLGEIDLVMQDGPTLCFVEVRYRRASAFGDGALSVDSHKQARIARAARHFLGQHPHLAQSPCRFDVVSIEGRWPARIAWWQNAFDAGAWA